MTNAYYFSIQMARVPIVQSDIDNDDNSEEADDNGLIKGNVGALVSDIDANFEFDLDNTKLVPTSRVVVSVTEGKYRMVRRVLHNAGHSVLQLHRVRYGSVFLKDLEGGEVRPCTTEEKEWAENLAKSISAARQVTISAAKLEKRLSNQPSE